VGGEIEAAIVRTGQEAGEAQRRNLAIAGLRRKDDAVHVLGRNETRGQFSTIDGATANVRTGTEKRDWGGFAKIRWEVARQAVNAWRRGKKGSEELDPAERGDP